MRRFFPPHRGYQVFDALTRFLHEDYCITACIRDALGPTRRKPNFREGGFLVAQAEEDRSAIRYSNMDIFDINYFVNTGENPMDFHLPISDEHVPEERAGHRVGHTTTLDPPLPCN